MSQEDISTRERIILATIDFIEKEGIHAVTTRGIAKAANVNSAAINYYFSTKDKLLEETLKHTLNHMLADIEDMMSGSGNDMKPMLENILMYYLEGASRYPGIIKAHLYDSFINKDSQSDFVKQFNHFLNSLFEKVSLLDSKEDADAARMKVVQMVSAVMFPVILPELFKCFAQIDFSRLENREAYLGYLLKQYL